MLFCRTRPSLPESFGSKKRFGILFGNKNLPPPVFNPRSRAPRVIHVASKGEAAGLAEAVKIPPRENEKGHC
jgi:hypothetical protein